MTEKEEGYKCALDDVLDHLEKTKSDQATSPEGRSEIQQAIAFVLNLRANRGHRFEDGPISSGG